MAVRGVTFITAALAVGIAALVLHLLALCSPQWKVTERVIEPIMPPVTYGLWQRCEYENKSLTEQGVAVGVRLNVPICYPNRYLRYSPSSYRTCNFYRNKCPVMNKNDLLKECSCRYLPSSKALQWLTVLAAICLVLGLILLYFKAIATPQNNSAAFVLSHGPFICFFLTLLLLVTGLILFGSYFRRYTYEGYFFPLEAEKYSKYNIPSVTYNAYSIRQYAKTNESKLTNDDVSQIVKELIANGNSHYKTRIGRATVYEIISTILVLIGTALTFWLVKLTASDEKL